MRPRLSLSTSSTMTSTSCEVETILPGWTFFLGPAQFGHVDQAFDAGFEFDESTVFGDVCHLTRQLHADRILGGYAAPTDRFRAASCRG